MTNVVVPASSDGKFSSCIFTTLPMMPDEWKSKKVPVDTLIKMSRRETELRVDDPFYRKMFFLMHRGAPGDAAQFVEEFTPRFVETAGVDPSEDPSLDEEPLVSSASVIILLQYQVLLEFGYNPLKDQLVLYELRTAAMMHPDVPELQSSVQFHYNRQGNPHDVAEGKVGPDTTLYDPATLEPHTLHRLLRDLTQKEVHQHDDIGMRFAHYPTVVLSGSYT
jgi:hypothetical protein